MTTKLTLSVDTQVIRRAKAYAQKHKKSLSEIVTRYLDHLSSEKGIAEEIDPEVLEVADEIPLDKMPKGRDPKFEYLKDKYLHE
jgi:hypothetical protein